MDRHIEALRALIIEVLTNDVPVGAENFRKAYEKVTEAGGWDGCPICGEKLCDKGHTSPADAGWQIKAMHDRGTHQFCSLNCDAHREALMDMAR